MLDGKGATQQMTVRAKYSDGTDRDVTSLALFLTQQRHLGRRSAPTALVTAGERGEAFVMARFDTFTVGSQVIVLPKGLKFKCPHVPENNYIDTLVDDKLKKLRIAPSGSAPTRRSSAASTSTSSACCRRAEEYDRFMADSRPDKRAKLVDELLEPQGVRRAVGA